MNSSDLKEDSGYYSWKKGEVKTLSKYFDSHEFDCQCKNVDCKDQKISKSLITKLDSIRIEIAQPLTVTSGFRCAKHQQEIRDSGVSTVVAKVSTHEKGDAADIRPKDGKMEGFETVCAKQFDSIGLAKTFLHCDLRTDKKNRRWNY